MSSCNAVNIVGYCPARWSNIIGNQKPVDCFKALLRTVRFGHRHQEWCRVHPPDYGTVAGFVLKHASPAPSQLQDHEADLGGDRRVLAGPQDASGRLTV